MPHENIWEERGVLKRFWGHLSGVELAASAEEVAASPHFDNLRYIINDFLALDGHARLDQRTLDALASVRFGSMATNPNIRVVFVANEALRQELSDAMRQRPLKGTHETVAFDTVEQAREWLAAQPPLAGAPRLPGRGRSAT
jgi:hypothetical protein